MDLHPCPPQCGPEAENLKGGGGYRNMTAMFHSAGEERLRYISRSAPRCQTRQIRLDRGQKVECTIQLSPLCNKWTASPPKSSCTEGMRTTWQQARTVSVPSLAARATSSAKRAAEAENSSLTSSVASTVSFASRWRPTLLCCCACACVQA